MSRIASTPSRRKLPSWVVGACALVVTLTGGACAPSSGGGDTGTTGSPLLVASTPANGAQDVAPPSEVAATFAEDMDAAAVDASWIRATVAGSALPGQVGIDPQDARRLVLQLTSAPAAGSTVLVDLSASIAFASGSTLGQSMQLSFTTAPIGGGGGVTTLVLDERLPDLRQAPSGSIDLRSLRPVDASGRLAATWTSSTFVENRFIETDDTLAAVETFAMQGLLGASEGIPDGAGGVVVTTLSNFYVFGPTPAHTTSGPAPLLGEPFEAGGARIVAPLSPAGAALSADFDPATATWAVQTNATGSLVQLDEPFAHPGGFQTLSFEAQPGGSTELQASFFDLQGFSLGQHRFGSTSSGALVYRRETRSDGKTLVVLAKDTPSGMDLFAFDFDPATGWSAPALMGSFLQSALGEGLFYNCAAQRTDGAAVFALFKPDQTCALLTRDAGRTTWSREDTTTFQRPLSCAITPGGACLVAGVGPANQLLLVGRAPGKSWSSVANAVTLGAVGARDIFGADIHVAPASGDRFLVVGLGLTGLLTNVEALRAALISAQ